LTLHRVFNFLHASATEESASEPGTPEIGGVVSIPTLGEIPEGDPAFIQARILWILLKYKMSRNLIKP
tara:strand:+ start:355 stop:558 length:204 start_codon:yes stop_codon:yes gene_type:complete